MGSVLLVMMDICFVGEHAVPRLFVAARLRGAGLMSLQRGMAMPMDTRPHPGTAVTPSLSAEETHLPL